MELVGFADKSFAIIYYSGSASCSTLLYYDADNLLKGNDCIASSMVRLISFFNVLTKFWFYFRTLLPHPSLETALAGMLI